MNEPNRRGRPPKAAAEQPEQKDYTDVQWVDVSPSQAYADRVWAGQSISLPRAERIARCIAALEGQGLPTDGLTFEDTAE